jgi:DNA helicase HerA-like ATPase
MRDRRGQAYDARSVPATLHRWKLLGTAETGERRHVGLAVTDARFHLHVLGSTGSGKSTLLARMILADAAAGRGALVIDPKGDLVTDLLDRLPAGVGDRLVLIDPAETSRRRR